MSVKSLLLSACATWLVTSCTLKDQVASPVSDSSALTDVAQTSSQLASGSSYTISGSTSSTSGTPPNGGPGGHGPGGPHHPEGKGFLDGTDLLAPTDQLLAIVDAESAGDFRGMRMHQSGGATVTNYDQSGNVISMPVPPQNSGGPEGCSFSGKQFPKFDSLLAKVAKTVIDFGTGVTDTHGATSITRSGKIIITRSGDGSTRSEAVTFDNYVVNGSKISGSKTRVSTFDSSSGSGSSTTVVVDGKISFNDGTEASWTSSKQRKSTITLDSNNRPASGQIVTEGSTAVTASDGSIVYSHTVTKPIIENVACGPRPPVSGTVETVYKTDKVSVDFGDGSCSNKGVTITLNGVTSARTFGKQ